MAQIDEERLIELAKSVTPRLIPNPFLLSKPAQGSGMGKEAGDKLIQQFLDAGVTG